MNPEHLEPFLAERYGPPVRTDRPVPGEVEPLPAAQGWRNLRALHEAISGGPVGEEDIEEVRAWTS